ncbi:MAG: HD domain-containing protein [Nitrospirae bacterium]|nr:HD domain-containing protein [Nitrospirota bacterium]
MFDLTLQYPVHTPDRLLLLPAGTVLTRETMEELASSHRSPSVQTCTLLQYGTTRDDLIHFLNKPPYQSIFDNQETVTSILGLMEGVELVLPFLKSLEYFRRHDFYTYHHILMVFALSTLLAKDLVPDYQDRIQEIATGPTHDFGKVCVPLEILRKSAPLTRSERDMLAHHTLAGYVLLSYYYQDPLNLAARVARDHHERKDGSGHPCGILLEDFMVEIIAVCDVYDALISPRPYRPVSYDNRSALEEITAMAERREIGWEVVRSLIAHNRSNKPHFSETAVSLDKRGAPPPGNVHGIIADGNDDPLNS